MRSRYVLVGAVNDCIGNVRLNPKDVNVKNGQKNNLGSLNFKSKTTRYCLLTSPNGLHVRQTQNDGNAIHRCN